MNYSALLLLLLAFACNLSQNIDMEKFVNNVEAGEEFVKVAECNKYSLVCKYRPKEYLALQELKSGYTRESFELETKNFVNALYFEVTVKNNEGKNIITELATSQEEYAWLVNYFNMAMQQDFFLLDQTGDSIPASSLSYLNTYGMSPELKFLVTFPKTATSKNEIIQLSMVNRLFDCQPVIKFDYQTNDLLNYKKPRIES